jgi:hypothetical protein
MAGEFEPSEEARKYYKKIAARPDVLTFAASTVGGQGARSISLSTFERFLPGLIDTATAIYQGTENVSSALRKSGKTEVDPDVVDYLRVLSDQYAQEDTWDREAAGLTVATLEAELGRKGISRLRLMIPVKVIQGTVEKLSQMSPPPSSGLRK